MDEIWKDIHFWKNGIEYDYCGLYLISNFGRVKSLNYKRTGKEKILKGHKDKGGYEYVVLCKNSKQKNFKVHRLVAHVFLSDSYFNDAQVNHIDENKTNNHVSNLEWCTSKYNCNYGTRNERHSGTNKGKFIGEKNPNLGSLVARYDLEMNLIDIKYQFEYVQMGFNKGNISLCCTDKQKSHKGYIFKYYKEVE